MKIKGQLHQRHLTSSRD